MRTGLALKLLALSLAMPVFASSAPAQDAPACAPLKQVAQIQMARSGDGLNWVPVMLNGAKKYMLLTTANRMSEIFPEAAADVSDKKFFGPANSNLDIYGNSSNTLLPVASLEYGPVELEDTAAFVSTQSNPGYAPSKLQIGKLGGVMFNDILAYPNGAPGSGSMRPLYDVELDFGTNRLNFFLPVHCEGKVVYWQSDVQAVVPISANLFWHPQIPVKVDGKDMMAVISTDTYHTVMNEDVAYDKLGVRERDKESVAFNDGPLPGFRRQFKTLEIGSLTIADPVVDVIPDKMRNRVRRNANANLSYNMYAIVDKDVKLPDIVLGANTLDTLHLYFAIKERKLYVTPAAAKAP